MEANLQIKTFNRHNRVKNAYENKRQDPYVNRISGDITYKRRSIMNVDRNPTHMGGGPEYLYNKRIEELKRKLQRREITVQQYKVEVQQAQLARFGRILDDFAPKPNYRHVKTENFKDTQPESVEETKDEEAIEDEVTKEEELTIKPSSAPLTTPELMNMINNTEQ